MRLIPRSWRGSCLCGLSTWRTTTSHQPPQNLPPQFHAQALSTWHVMQRLAAEYPCKEFRFVIGADLIDQLKTWDAPGVPVCGAGRCLCFLSRRPSPHGASACAAACVAACAAAPGQPRARKHDNMFGKR